MIKLDNADYVTAHFSIASTLKDNPVFRTVMTNETALTGAIKTGLKGSYYHQSSGGKDGDVGFAINKVRLNPTICASLHSNEDFTLNDTLDYYAENLTAEELAIELAPATEEPNPEVEGETIPVQAVTIGSIARETQKDGIVKLEGITTPYFRIMMAHDLHKKMFNKAVYDGK